MDVLRRIWKDLIQDIEQIQQARLFPRADIKGLSGCGRMLRRKYICAHHIAHIDQVARLLAEGQDPNVKYRVRRGFVRDYAMQLGLCLGP